MNLIAKLAGNACNLDCRYCFEKRKSVSNNPMLPAILEKAIRMVPKPCSLVMHGGEPLIVGRELFQEYLDIISTYYPEKINAVRVQTNGVLLDDEWVELLFRRNRHLNIEIAISLDGTRNMNLLRIDCNGRNSFEQVRSAFRLLERYGIRAGMLSVISRQTLQSSGAVEYARFLKSISNLAFVKVNALFDIEDNELKVNSITPSAYSMFIVALAREYIKEQLYERFPIEPLLSILQKIRGCSSRYCNYSTRKCFHYLSLYPDGTIGFCDCLPLPDFIMGNVDCNSIESAIIRATRSEDALKLQTLLQQCKSCNIYDFCLGGCLSQRYYFSGNPDMSRDFCESKHILYRAFTKFASNAYADV